VNENAIYYGCIINPVYLLIRIDVKLTPSGRASSFIARV